MSHLNDYLAEKRAAVLARNAAVDAGSAQPLQLKASVKAEGRSGVRRLRIRDHQVISDSPPNFAGYDLGPSSPELQLGVLGTCVTYIFLIQAAERQVPLESLEVEVTGIIDPRGGKPGHEHADLAAPDRLHGAHRFAREPSRDRCAVRGSGAQLPDPQPPAQPADHPRRGQARELEGAGRHRAAGSGRCHRCLRSAAWCAASAASRP